MQIPGFIQSALVIGLVAGLYALLDSVYVEFDPMIAPVIAASITALIKAVQVWFSDVSPAVATRSMGAEKSSWERFLTG